MKLSSEQTAHVESEILKRVRSHPGISRVALARKLQISPSTIGNYTGRLITQGFLTESESPDNLENEAGRPPIELRLNPNGGQFVGVDFEARNIMATSVDFSDHPLKYAHREIHETDSVSDILGKIAEAIAEVMPSGGEPVLAIGLGVPGFVNPEQGVAGHYKYIKQWRNVQLVAPLAERFRVPVYLENCVRTMALAELWFGQGRGETDWLCLGIRSGIGAGIVVGGQLLRGQNYRAGEVGRWFCPWPAAAASHFFRTGESASATHAELQEVASVRAILAAIERARESGEKTILSANHGPLNIRDVVRAAQQRDPLTIEIVEVAAEMLGWAVGELSLVLAPSRVILAGPLTLLGDILLHPLQSRAQETLRAVGTEAPLIINSTMGEFSGAMGAAALAIHEWQPPKV